MKDKAISIIESDKLLMKYLYEQHWISGSSTIVYPISVWTTSKMIELQVKNGAWRLRKHIQKIVADNPTVFSAGYFCKLDGSCPDEIRFHYH